MAVEYTRVNYHGILVTPDGENWYLMDNKPIDRVGWMNDNERMFLVATSRGYKQHLIVSGYYILPYREGTIEVRQEVAE